VDETTLRSTNSTILKLHDVSIKLGVYCHMFTQCSLVTLFLYMVAELSAVQQIINALTGLNGLPAVIVQCAVTTIYTCRVHLSFL
jgi:hypothetical protein